LVLYRIFRLLQKGTNKKYVPGRSSALPGSFAKWPFEKYLGEKYRQLPPVGSNEQTITETELCSQPAWGRELMCFWSTAAGVGGKASSRVGKGFPFSFALLRTQVHAPCCVPCANAPAVAVWSTTVERSTPVSRLASEIKLGHRSGLGGLTMHGKELIN